jgi:hypothetical protein
MLAASFVLFLAACDSPTEPPPPPPPPTLTACTQSTVEQDDEGIDPRNLIFFDFSVPDSGRLDVTLDWTVSASRMGFYLVPANTCTTLQEFNNRSCNFLIRSEPPGTKPRKISTPNFAAGNYRWIVGNFEDNTKEAFSLRIVLSTSTCPALVGAPPAAEARDGERPTVAGMTQRR